MRLTLKDDGYPTFKKIMRGSKWIGRVAKVKNGYLGKIGREEVTEPTESKAFHEVAARHMGYASLAALQEHNAKVASHNRDVRRRVAPARAAIRNGDVQGFIRAIDDLLK